MDNNYNENFPENNNTPNPDQNREPEQSFSSEEPEIIIYPEECIEPQKESAPEPQPTPPAEEPPVSGTYSYTAGNNPSINRDSAGGIHTTYIPRPNPTPNPNGQNYYQGSNIPPVNPNSRSKNEKKKVPLALFIVSLCACLVFSAVFGIGGVIVGYNAVERVESSPAASEGNGNGSLDVDQGEKVKVELPEGSIAAAAERAGSSVVEITTETVTTSFFYGQYVQSGAGSGVIIDADDGYIITCAHVIEGASTVTVTLKDGKEHKATIVGSDPSTDIAVIKIEASGLVAATIGNSDNLVVGQDAIAIGNPLGTLGGSVSSGIISALDREITIDGQEYSLLQIDTSINPGNSGGGLFDIEGNLIGVVNAKSGGTEASGTTIEGLGFAIPINHAIEIASQLVDQGYVGGRVNLGIYVYEVTSDTDSMELYQSKYADLLDYITAYGVYFLEYQSGQEGDFEFGDRIIAIDGVSVTTRSDITSVLGDYEVGDTVPITVSRVTSDMKRSRIVEFETTLVEATPESITNTED